MERISRAVANWSGLPALSRTGADFPRFRELERISRAFANWSGFPALSRTGADFPQCPNRSAKKQFRKTQNRQKFSRPQKAPEFYAPAPAQGRGGEGETPFFAARKKKMLRAPGFGL
jgi:hypothetical protein